MRTPHGAAGESGWSIVGDRLTFFNCVLLGPKAIALVDKEIRIPVAVIVEQRQPVSRWSDVIWRPVAVLPGPVPDPEDTVLRRTETAIRHFAGHATLCLYASDAEAYKFNLDSSSAALYVILRDAEGGALPVRPHLVTASPYEAQDYLDSGHEIVERVAMPEAIRARIAAFVDAFFVEQPFRKRRREPADGDQRDVGGAPIAMRSRGRRGGGGVD